VRTGPDAEVIGAIDEVVAVVSSGASEDVLGCVVVVSFEEGELVVCEGVSGECSGALFDIVFGVVSDAEAEEFHDLACEVFVGSVSSAVVVVEVGDHGGVADDLVEQFAVVSERVLAEELVLEEHVVGVFDGAVAGCEVAVPEEGHLFFEGARGLDHAGEPPVLDLSDLSAVSALAVLAHGAQAGLELAVVIAAGAGGLFAFGPGEGAHDVVVKEVCGGPVVVDLFDVDEVVDGLFGAP